MITNNINNPKLGNKKKKQQSNEHPESWLDNMGTAANNLVLLLDKIYSQNKWFIRAILLLYLTSLTIEIFVFLN